MKISNRCIPGFVFCLVLIGLCGPLSGQSTKGRFGVGVVLGLNAAQIDGDSYAGYRKLGFQTGLRSTARITDRFFLSTEILLSQRGARPSRKEKLEDFDNYIDVRLTYIEVPFLLNLNVGRKETNYYHYLIFGGLSIGRLIHTRINETGDSVRFYPYLRMNGIKDQFTLFDTSLLLGLQRNLSAQLGLFLKHTLTLKRLYTPVNNEDVFNELEPFHFTFGLSYLLY